ncbi:hypothetical protein PGT21_024282 [Puccinia graminis f. sp. tritici]|uniref:Uncharacterized protein n=1 Tax=Puccinia graminis f. sp. tritici TaxID=56615 RepID=A0A5B0LQ41_PUCGR|nr:hypothetical protein PGT21_024282 [Puccinia graminis f. sp. tritici]
MPENDIKCPKCLAQATNGKPQSGKAPQYGRGLPTDSGKYGFQNPPPDHGGSLSPPRATRLFWLLAELPSELLNTAGVDQSCPRLLSLAALAAFHPPPLNFTAAKGEPIDPQTVRDALNMLK